MRGTRYPIHPYAPAPIRTTGARTPATVNRSGGHQIPYQPSRGQFRRRTSRTRSAPDPFPPHQPVAHVDGLMCQTRRAFLPHESHPHTLSPQPRD
jgi:hypothetical protein